ncbi:YicC/YloC family endoribonuclease [Lagierella sp.]|uniref:YicC/YloC family endoribonuclease n=1 Tax=Lagierella sp. TaxID=2849657 RepID=UPI0026308AAB|nr:YicC/YloC family endoribonuclease [Lagierella sp.]
MIYSMTGFGRATREVDNYSISVEVKTVNNKYLDVQVKNPHFLNFLEEDIKKFCRQNLGRGRVDVYIRGIKKEKNISNLSFDEGLVLNYLDAVKRLEGRTEQKFEVSLNEILQLEGALIIEEGEDDDETLKKLVLQLMKEALESLINMRRIEGNNISSIIIEQLNEISSIVENISKLASSSQEEYKENLLYKLKDISRDISKLDMDRIYLEVALYGERSDITEEIVRLKSHIDQFSNTLKSDCPMGRKLDFIIQEMNREVNTISSKSPNKIIVQHCIDLKTIIEKIREQVQNIE